MSAGLASVVFLASDRGSASGTKRQHRWKVAYVFGNKVSS